MQIPRRENAERERGASDDSIRKWIESSKKAESKLDFNSKKNSKCISSPFPPSDTPNSQYHTSDTDEGLKSLLKWF